MRRFPLVLAAFSAALLLAPAAHADTLGQSQTFTVDSTYDADGRAHVDATMRALGGRAYFYVDNRYWDSLSPTQRTAYQDRLSGLAFQFDGTIYPDETAFFGSEASPGVDGDPHVTVLLERLVAGSGGYFQQLNNYPADVAPQSNEREMVFVSAESVTSGLARDFLAHEFQHLISFNQKELLRDVSDDIWFNEGRSEYAVTVSGYNTPYSGSALQRRVGTFLRSPSDSLVGWPNTVADYGVTSVFVHYLADRYGPGIVGATLRSTTVGIPSVNEWLAFNGRAERFPDVFADWTAAVLANRSGDSRFGYRTSGLDGMHVQPTEVMSVSEGHPGERDLSLEEWQPSWVRMDLPGSGEPPYLNVAVDAAGGRLEGAYVADYAGIQSIGTWSAPGEGTVTVPTVQDGRALGRLTFTVAFGSDGPFESGDVGTRRVSVVASLAQSPGAAVAPPTGGTPGLADGDLIRKGADSEVYVIWGPYKRFMVPGTLELYGFQDRPVTSVTAEVFNRYATSNYIRQAGTEPVYAVWPDGTKHHLAITAAQWDASGRDWNAIFIVNEREAGFYATGEPITR